MYRINAKITRVNIELRFDTGNLNQRAKLLENNIDYYKLIEIEYFFI